MFPFQLVEYKNMNGSINDLFELNEDNTCILSKNNE